MGSRLLSNGNRIGEHAFGGAGILISKGLMQFLIPKWEECIRDENMVGGDQRTEVV